MQQSIELQKQPPEVFIKKTNFKKLSQCLFFNKVAGPEACATGSGVEFVTSCKDNLGID